MMNETLRSDIASANPVADHDDAKLSDHVRRMTAAAQEAALVEPPALTPWWRRRRIVVPLGIAGVVALTGAAVAIPLGLMINGTEVALDAEIPIMYVTDTGVDVNCRYGIYFGDPAHRNEADERLAEFVEKHDWTGIGQRIYEEAIANPFVPGPNDDWDADTQDLRDKFSFNRATSLIWEEIPDDLQPAGQSAGGTMDCTGQLR